MCFPYKRFEQLVTRCSSSALPLFRNCIEEGLVTFPEGCRKAFNWLSLYPDAPDWDDEEDVKDYEQAMDEIALVDALIQAHRDHEAEEKQEVFIHDTERFAFPLEAVKGMLGMLPLLRNDYNIVNFQQLILSYIQPENQHNINYPKGID